jgi:hypothetical protein
MIDMEGKSRTEHRPREPPRADRSSLAPTSMPRLPTTFEVDRECTVTVGSRPWLSPVVRNRVFTEADALSRGTLWGSVRATPLRRYPLSVQTSDLNLSGLTLQTGRSTPLAVLGALPPETVWLIIPLDGRETLRLRSSTAGRLGVAVCGAGAEYEMANRCDASWGLVALPTASVDTLLSLPRNSAIRRRGKIAWMCADPRAWASAAILMREAAEVTAQDPDVFQVEEARRSLRASVLDACDELLVGRSDGEKPRALRIESPSLRRMCARPTSVSMRTRPGRPTRQACPLPSAPRRRGCARRSSQSSGSVPLDT